MTNGNINLIYGAKSKKSKRADNDFYATNPVAIFNSEQMFKETNLNETVWECACGEGNISIALEWLGYNVYSTDLIDRGYGNGQIDFLQHQQHKFTLPNGKTIDGKLHLDIVTNPPFNQAQEFIEKSMEVLANGCKSYWFVKIQFLESIGRKKLFERYPPKYIYAFSSRQSCTKNNRPDIYGWGGTFFYCWIIFEVGYKGETILRWI